MFKKILIANRGEVAAGIAKSCSALGIRTVGVFSEPDWNALHVKIANDAFCIGMGPSRDSYMNIDEIIDVARRSGADAIHPGWGFLAENFHFARRCEQEGITFIGPDSGAIKMAALKVEAKATVASTGIPVVSGSGVTETVEEARKAAIQLGFPVLIKANNGKGGRIIARVPDAEGVSEAFKRLTREASSSGEIGGLFVEKYVENAHHIEFQVLADGKGNVTVLPEMNCSLQRRFQKLLEESPTTVIEDDMRDKLVETTIEIARKFNIRGAAGIEYLVDNRNNFFFLEINPRLAVERAVAEVLTGLDIVEEQIRIAAGEDIGISTTYLKPRGWALECHINAEDPEMNFAPVPGRINTFNPPGGTGIRVDTGVYAGYEIPIYYDSCIAKLVVSGRDRIGVIRRTMAALEQFLVKGVSTTVPFFKNLLRNEYFQEGQVTTDFSQHELFLSLCRIHDVSDETAALVAALDVHLRERLSRNVQSGYRWGKTDNPWGMAGRNGVMQSRNL